MQLNKKLKSYYFGYLSEVISSFYLKLLFYKSLEHRYKTPFGEIDLIVKKGKTIIFLEIKGRKDISNMEFIGSRQQKRITKAAEFFLIHNPKYKLFQIRFDAIFVNRFFLLKHIKNYW